MFFLLVGVFACAQSGTNSSSNHLTKHITNYEECVAAGFPILKTHPPRCVDSDQTVYIKQNKDSDLFASGGGAACSNLCGDGKCQEVVCMAVGCPCAETRDSCPQDCLR
ncbi:MAG TPA: hypothetical protein PKD37_04605 [Oligoflexia bacterium]|nr:hypothetical protein [Oligoflexia bacterium]HMP27245.1 hypothetical protein [Oligoflexia bacterium]